MSGCQTCGGPLPTAHRSRKFCSEPCRKAQYDRACIECGARISGTDPGKTNGRCVLCANRRNGEDRKVWTREHILKAIRAWADAHGEAPSEPDWNATRARYINDPERAARAERGYAAGLHPWSTTVIREFGTWNAGIAAAGFTPRPAHGGGANVDRRRKATA